MTAMSLDPRLWPHLHPLLIAHDIGASRDRSTAVVGGFCRYVPGILGIKEFSELPQDLYGSARASALAQIDARYDRNALIFADLSNDSSYGEQMLETFGPRVIGVHGRHGNGTQVERRPVGRGCLPIYHVVVRLWQEKRGEVEPRDLSHNLVVQLGAVTEELNRRWYEANTGQRPVSSSPMIIRASEPPMK